MVILLLSYSCQMPSSSVKSCRSNCSTFTEIKHMVDSTSQLFGLKGHKASPATQNPECPIFQLSLRVCGMVRGYQWIKSNDFSKILLKIIVVWKIFITVPYSCLHKAYSIGMNYGKAARSVLHTNPFRFSSVLLFSSLDSYMWADMAVTIPNLLFESWLIMAKAFHILNLKTWNFFLKWLVYVKSPKRLPSEVLLRKDLLS